MHRNDAESGLMADRQGPGSGDTPPNPTLCTGDLGMGTVMSPPLWPSLEAEHSGENGSS